MFSGFIKKLMMARQIQFKEGRFEMFGLSGVILPVFTYTAMLESLYEEQGEDMFDTLFSVGRKHGALGIEAMGKEHGVAKRRFFSEMIGSANVMGLGALDVSSFNPDKREAVLTIEGSPLVQSFRESETLQHIDHPIHDFMRGVMHEMMAHIVDGDGLVSTEESCEYLGDDRCRIRVVPEE